MKNCYKVSLINLPPLRHMFELNLLFSHHIKVARSFTQQQTNKKYSAMHNQRNDHAIITN